MKIILIIPYRGIGDLIFHLPLIRGISEEYNTKINLITNKVNKAKDLLVNESSVKKIEYISFQRENQLKNSYKFYKKINSLNSDICILTAPTKRLIIPLVLSNSKKKVYFKKDKTKLSKEMRDAIERGMKYSAKEYTDAIDFMKQSYESYKEVFEDYHGIITPSSSGVADKGLKSTGSADFQKTWTYLGLPTISLPLLTGENDLPLGVQLVGDKLDDLRFLGTANWLEKNCKDEG